MKKVLFLLVLLNFFNGISAQTITGVVTDENDTSLIPGVSVIIKGTNIGVITDLNGAFSIDISGHNPVLVFSYIGYEKQEIRIENQRNINVRLKPSSTDLDEVIVVGYGVQKKSLVTGAIAKIDGKDLSKGADLRITQAMQGKTAGVVIMNNSGQPGDFVSVRVRGVGTNGDNEPLYIIDGLPNNGYGIDYLSPEDIESIEVLKDAAASAIYGARAANGVVLITTKRGTQNQKTVVSYSGYFGWQTPWRKIGVLDKNDYTMLINEAALNAGQAPVFDQGMIDTLANTDWQDEMFYYNAPKMSHSISLTGGSKKFTYSSSISYFGQDGIVAKGNSNFQRVNYRLNTTGKFGLMEVGTNLNYAFIENKGISANNQYASTSLIQALNAPPIVPVYMPDGSFGTPEKYGLGMQEITNPIAMLSYLNSNSRTNKVIAGIYADFDFGELFQGLKGLKYRSQFGNEFVLVSNRSYTPIYNLDATHKTLVNTVYTGMNKYGRYNWENTLTYTKSIGVHNFSILLGHAAFKEWSENVGGSKSDLPFDEFDKAYIDNATDPQSAVIGGGYSEHTILSYFGRINYDLLDRYMLTAIFRADGSSRFGSDNKFGYFPSVSVGWIFSKENFFNSLTSVINFAKLRLSWGQNGNESIGDFRYTSVMSNQSIYYFGINKTQYNGTQPSSISNPKLKWETSEQTNVGLDLQFLNNMLYLTADYYVKKTNDWLVQAPAPLMLGNVPPVINGGDVQNTGVELELGFKQRINSFNINISVTGAYNKNKVIDIKNEEKKLYGGVGGHGQNGIIVAEVGMPLGYFSGYETDGIFQTVDEITAYAVDGNLIQPNAVPGDLKFVDKNGDGKLNDADRVMIGNPIPDFTGGLNVNLEWNGFDFNMFWYTALGHQIWNATHRFDLNYTNYTYKYLNRWTGEGTSNDIPRVTLNDLNNNLKTASDFFVEDADFVRLKNLSIGYTLPKYITKFAKISKFRIFIVVENLLTFTKYSGFDPEIGGGIFGNGIDHGIYPQAKSFLFGINLTF